jgi:hypothetical protein
MIANKTTIQRKVAEPTFTLYSTVYDNHEHLMKIIQTNSKHIQISHPTIKCKNYHDFI